MSEKPILVLGMMSGTSADGIDVALARISGEPPGLKAKLMGHTSVKFPVALRKEILHVAEGHLITANELSQLNFRLGEVFADAALSACTRFRVSPSRVDLLGTHGQTVFHQGVPAYFFGRKVASTLQIGEQSIIAASTGITTVGDFRPADIALGGQGAPLVPYADYLLYRHPTIGRVSLNIGGIANVTVIPAGALPDQVFAFDTGPGNMLIDALVSHFTHGRQRYDKDAHLARSGVISRPLMKALLQDPYLKVKPPKSTGREYYGATYIKKVLALARRYDTKSNDLIRTVTTFTAVCVSDALHTFVLPKHKVEEIVVSGGGAQNPLLLEALQILTLSPPREVYSGVDRGRRIVISVKLPAPGQKASPMPKDISLLTIRRSSEFGIPEDAKEAFAFALLAYESFHQRPANLPSATGARGPAILGKISYAPPR
jgi:anhydro-N-acetylmuramic acid kinase